MAYHLVSRHSGVTAAVRAALDRFDRRGSGGGRRRRRIERARPTAIGIIHVVKPRRRRRSSSSPRSADGAAVARVVVSSNRRPGLTNDFVRTRFRLSTRSSERQRATCVRRRQAAYGHRCLYMTSVIPLRVALYSLVCVASRRHNDTRKPSLEVAPTTFFSFCDPLTLTYNVDLRRLPRRCKDKPAYKISRSEVI